MRTRSRSAPSSSARALATWPSSSAMSSGREPARRRRSSAAACSRSARACRTARSTSVVSSRPSSWSRFTTSPSRSGNEASRPDTLVAMRTSVASTWPFATRSSGSPLPRQPPPSTAETKATTAKTSVGRPRLSLLLMDPSWRPASGPARAAGSISALFCAMPSTFQFRQAAGNATSARTSHLRRECAGHIRMQMLAELVLGASTKGSGPGCSVRSMAERPSGESSAWACTIVSLNGEGRGPDSEGDPGRRGRRCAGSCRRPRPAGWPRMDGRPCRGPAPAAR